MLNTLLHPLLGLGGWEAYALVGVLCFGEAALLLGFFLPGETAVVFGGVIAYEHHVSLIGMIVLVVVCAIAGDTVGYEVGRHFGPTLLAHRPLKERPAVDKTRDLVNRRGSLAVFVGRFTAVFRTLVPGMAGMSGVPYPRFALANAAGGLIWGVGYTMAGYLVGHAYESVLKSASYVSYGLIGAFALAFVGWQVRKRLRERRELLEARSKS